MAGREEARLRGCERGRKRKSERTWRDERGDSGRAKNETANEGAGGISEKAWSDNGSRHPGKADLKYLTVVAETMGPNFAPALIFLPGLACKTFAAWDWEPTLLVTLYCALTEVAFKTIIHDPT